MLKRSTQVLFGEHEACTGGDRQQVAESGVPAEGLDLAADLRIHTGAAEELHGEFH